MNIIERTSKVVYKYRFLYEDSHSRGILLIQCGSRGDKVDGSTWNLYEQTFETGFIVSEEYLDIAYNNVLRVFKRKGVSEDSITVEKIPFLTFINGNGNEIEH